MDIKNFNFIKKLQDSIVVDRIILYGSRARGTHRERSDIDLAIDCPKATEKDWRNIYNIIMDQNDTLLEIDCVRYDALDSESHFKKEIDKDSKIIFTRGEL